MDYRETNDNPVDVRGQVSSYCKEPSAKMIVHAIGSYAIGSCDNRDQGLVGILLLYELIGIYKIHD